MKPKKAKGPKKVTVRLIPRTSEYGAPMYDMLERLVVEYHDEILEARIALAWNLAWKPDVDGRVTLGKCKKASDLDRELADFDFVIILRREFWANPMVTDDQRRALLDHELCHATVKYDEKGEPEIDERERKVYRIRKHGIEEFEKIVERHGCYTRDVERFYAALLRAERHSKNFVGYETLRQRLAAVGADVPLDAIVTWTALERREADTWAKLKAEGLVLEPQIPAHIVAAAQTRAMAG